MNDYTPNIVHEAEASRQHVRIPLPAKVRIGSYTYDAADWSNGGVSLTLPRGEAPPPSFLANKDEVHSAHIIFSFSQFSTDLPIRLRVANVDLSGGRIGCQFHDMNREQRSIVQYFVTSYMSGEVVRIGDLIDVVARNNMTRARAVPKQEDTLSPSELAKMKTQKWLKTGLLALASLILCISILTSLYERLFIVQFTTAQLTGKTLTVDTSAGGKIYYAPIEPDTLVAKGQPLFAVSTESGNMVSVDSPCDCIVKHQLLENNQTVNKATSAITLVRPDTKPFVNALLKNDEAVRLSVGQEALVALPGKNQHFRAAVRTIQAHPSLNGTSRITLIPEVDIPAEFIDDPVEVRVDTLSIL